MRVDKFLWCVRYFKTRSIATNACKQGKVKMDGTSVKPSKEIFPADKLKVRKNQIDYEIEVIDLPPSRVGAKLVNLYIVDVTPKEAFEKLELLKYSKDYYRKKGAGRPTKKDRRDIDDWFENTDPNPDEKDKEV
ncbi:RNA-binding S4 domain-containing protein [Salegentibacter sp. JZCK2]|uniref:RNA-binding S4 domain-containing protein n=1 Tax=Salegentibacter tibetensis TaxID=2873600 RepID=UPI001CCA84C7|nr:RNA-binding S4 domain-containing protein [Salegentibacter tibetensis]MBZ9731213.1 RNA-binding S4 domain-containing protein [Salegentibacter tibetensis]